MAPQGPFAGVTGGITSALNEAAALAQVANVGALLNNQYNPGSGAPAPAAGSTASAAMLSEAEHAAAVARLATAPEDGLGKTKSDDMVEKQRLMLKELDETLGLAKAKLNANVTPKVDVDKAITESETIKNMQTTITSLQEGQAKTNREVAQVSTDLRAVTSSIDNIGTTLIEMNKNQSAMFRCVSGLAPRVWLALLLHLLYSLPLPLLRWLARGSRPRQLVRLASLPAGCGCSWTSGGRWSRHPEPVPRRDCREPRRARCEAGGSQRLPADDGHRSAEARCHLRAAPSPRWPARVGDLVEPDFPVQEHRHVENKFVEAVRTLQDDVNQPSIEEAVVTINRAGDKWTLLEALASITDAEMNVVAPY